MANNSIPLTPPTFPPGYCFPATPQQLFNDAITFGEAVNIPSTSFGSIVSATVPASTARNLIWFKVDANNNFIAAYSFSQQYNLWVVKHPLPPADTANTVDAGERRIYMGTLVGLQSYDGGDGGTNATIGDTTGPMWQQDTIWSNTGVGYSPVGIPSTVFAITTPGTHVNTNTGTATSAVGVMGCYFIMRTARLYYVGA